LKTVSGEGVPIIASADDVHVAAENLALVLTRHGLQRMTARVLAALLFSERPSVTMSELAETLAASSGSISGALTTLKSVGLAEQVPMPGSRRDHYRLRDDAWALLFTNQNQTLAAMQGAADAGIAVAGANSVAGRRLTHMRDFYGFLLAEIPDLLHRWEQQRDG
jgi:DNA-binding MarR family transcriptional regulator